MKFLFFILTFTFHLILTISLKPLDNFYLITIIILSALGFGFVMTSRKQNINPLYKSLGWGLVSGSIIFLILLLLFMFFLANALSR